MTTTPVFASLFLLTPCIARLLTTVIGNSQRTATCIATSLKNSTSARTVIAIKNTSRIVAAVALLEHPTQ
jgi:hypothetical protein